MQDRRFVYQDEYREKSSNTLFRNYCNNAKLIALNHTVDAVLIKYDLPVQTVINVT